MHQTLPTFLLYGRQSWMTQFILAISLWGIIFPSAVNKGRSTVIYRQSSTFDRPYLSCNNHCDWWIFQEFFFVIIS